MLWRLDISDCSNWSAYDQPSTTWARPIRDVTTTNGGLTNTVPDPHSHHLMGWAGDGMHFGKIGCISQQPQVRVEDKHDQKLVDK